MLTARCQRWRSHRSSYWPAGEVIDPRRFEVSSIADYSKPGDLVADPYAGAGTTLLAAAELGREAIGAELDPNTYEIARARIGAGIPQRLPGLEET